MKKKNFLAPPSKKSTYFTISNKVNCSISTISRYFNNGYISQQKKQAIEKAIAELNYTQNPIAKAMRQRDYVIFLLTMSIKNATNSAVIDGICNALQTTIQLFLNDGNNNPIIFQKSLNSTLLRNPLCLIVFEDKTPINTKEQLEKLNLPIYFYSFEEHFSTNKFFFNYYIDENDAFQELIEKMIFIEKLENIYFINYQHTSESIYTNSFLQLKREKIVKKIISKLKKLQNLNINFKVITLKQNSSKEIDNYFQKRKWKNNSGVICGSHTIFRSLRYLNNLNQKIIVSDIGYLSLTDYQDEFNYKIFIDYFALGQMIGNDILKWINQEEIFYTSNKYDAKLIYYQNNKFKI